MDYKLVQADATADRFRGLNVIARFGCPERAVAYVDDAARRGDVPIDHWFLVDPVGRAIAGVDDLFDEQ